jgi:hypothetical protein
MDTLDIKSERGILCPNFSQFSFGGIAMRNTIKETRMKTTEYRIDALIVRTAIFMAGKVQAMATAKARADGFGREIFGFMKTTNFSKN